MGSRPLLSKSMLERERAKLGCCAAAGPRGKGEGEERKRTATRIRLEGEREGEKRDLIFGLRF